MKTKLKKFISVILMSLSVSAFLVSTPAIAASAEQNVLLASEMKEYLLSLNIPEAYLNVLTDEEIADEYAKYYGKEIGCIKTVTSTLSESVDVPSLQRGTIPSEDMRFEITTSTIYKNSSTKEVDIVYVYVTYYWENLPLWRRTDAAIVNWDSSVFTYDSDSFASYVVYANSDLQTYRYQQTTPNEITQEALGYEVKLTPTELDGTIIKINGSCTFRLYPRSNPFYETNSNATSYYSTAINAQYRHNRNPFIASVGLEVKGVSITFDLSALTDTAAVSTNYFYHY